MKTFNQCEKGKFFSKVLLLIFVVYPHINSILNIELHTFKTTFFAFSYLLMFTLDNNFNMANLNPFVLQKKS